MLSKDYSIKDFTFDDKNKEIIFHRYDMPTPWMNYLSNGNMHAMISQAGGALAFYRSPQIWRINRYRFFHLPTDRSGIYVYVLDNQTKKYVSLTGEPCEQKPEKFESAHGMGYTRFKTTANNIDSKLTYFVAPDNNVLILNGEMTNTSDKERNITTFCYVEFALMEFLREIQWQCYNKHQVNSLFDENSQAIIYDYAVEDQLKPDETPLVYFASNQKLSGFDGDREKFIGSYRSESNPLCVEEGKCSGSSIHGGDPCGALQVDFTLKPGETKKFCFYLGVSKKEENIKDLLDVIRVRGYEEKQFAILKKNFDKVLCQFTCEIPDKRAERMVNIWNPYQVWYNYIFSRNISFYATGTFRGTGFRDTAQDIIAIAPLNIKMAKEKAIELLSQQYQDGHVNHYYFPIEGMPPVTSIHSDDHLWPILTIYSIVSEDTSSEFLNEQVPYYDGGSDSVYNHLLKSIDFTKSKMGAHGFPLMLRSDWNDSLYRVCRNGKGESIWTSMQLGICCKRLAELARLQDCENDALDLENLYNEQKNLVNTKAWDGEWYRRAITDDGLYLGSKSEPQAKIWLNSQTWSVLSGFADAKRGKEAMDSVKKYLDTDIGIKKIDPSMKDYPSKKDSLTNYNKGTSENGGIFCHANAWAIIAECILGRPENAWKYYKQLIPLNASEKAGVGVYSAEPFVYSSNIFGPESDKFGYANVSWLSGTAAWMYIAVTQYILGIKPRLHGLEVKPCIPADWNEYRCTRWFRGSKYNFAFIKGEIKEIFVDDKKIDGNLIQVSSEKIINVKVVY